VSSDGRLYAQDLAVDLERTNPIALKPPESLGFADLAVAGEQKGLAVFQRTSRPRSMAPGHHRAIDRNLSARRRHQWSRCSCCAHGHPDDRSKRAGVPCLRSEPIDTMRANLSPIRWSLLILACTTGGPRPGTFASVDRAGEAGAPVAGAPVDSTESANAGVTEPASPSDRVQNGGTPFASTPADEPVETAPRVRATGPGDWIPGDYPPALRAQEYLEIRGVTGQAELARQYKVHVPPGYDAQRPTPLVLCFHGLAQNAVSFCVDGSDLVGKADELGYVLVMPNGFENSWNAGTCCGTASERRLDDVALVRAIVAEVGTHLNVDLDRVYATGFSNGGYLSLRLACEAADLVAAVAPGSGAIGTNDSGGGTNAMSDFVACEPTRAVSVLAFHGTEDTLVPYALHQPTIAHLAAANGCAMTTTAALEPPSSGDTTCLTYAECPAGGEVTGCTVAGGGHVWFGDASCGTGVGLLGCLFVGANSQSLVNTQAAGAFFEREAALPTGSR
jgi:polyhydroxybutyrate depolymerase